MPNLMILLNKLVVHPLSLPLPLPLSLLSSLPLPLSSLLLSLPWCVLNFNWTWEKGYITEAEQYGWSFVLENLASDETIQEADKGLGRVQNALEWLAVKGANWRHPHGTDSYVKDNKKLQNHPVTQVSYNDAFEYCAWASRVLPTEIEWEYAARGAYMYSYIHIHIHIFIHTYTYIYT